MKKNFTKNQSKKVAVKNVKVSKDKPSQDKDEDTISISSVSSIKSTSSVTVHKRTSYVETTSVVALKAGKNDTASRNQPDGNIASVSEIRSVVVEDVETTTTTSVEDIIVFQTAQAEKVPIAGKTGNTIKSERDMEMTSLKIESGQGGKASSKIDAKQLQQQKELQYKQNSTKANEKIPLASDTKTNSLIKNQAKLSPGKVYKDFDTKQKYAKNNYKESESQKVATVINSLKTDECLHYVHHWDEDNSVSNEMVASVREMELILAKELVRRFRNYSSDKYSDSPMFYHDHAKGQTLVLVDKDFHIEPNRQDLLRVIGCGHFLLSYFCDAISYAIEECRRVESLDWAVSFLTSVRSQWKESVLNKLTRCDETVGIGNHFNDLATKWLAMNVEHHSGDELKQWLDLNAVKFTCKTMCFSDRNKDLASMDRRAYKEFLFLHMACIVDHDDPQNIDPKLLKQYRLLNRSRLAETAADMNTTSLPEKQTNQGEKNFKSDSRKVTDGAGMTSLIEKKGLSSLSTAAALSLEDRMNTPRNLQKLPIQQPPGSESASFWQSCDSFQPTDWFKSEDGKTIKVTNKVWKLGCKGCPEGMQEMPSKNEKSARKCKWITVKRTILVKRPGSKDSVELRTDSK
ncbi:hypothetical protein BOX15_Mlig016002g1 [Macrostomum lignano]|uniref:Uncharacterized protein n=1 Tax=Macrostomum lignano TaxID=282301 RepID=A0A267GPW3_9PLAT|nr:hypothetical protein BOX15_Mlig016002g1 [Macrostomum lignano]